MRSIGRARHAAYAAVTLACAGACASPAAPPGGPEDKAAPVLVATTPDSGAVRSRDREVEFRFDEVISETPRGGSLETSVIVSPRDGEPDVEWHRDRITVRPRRGWRENTTYVVTLLPGIADLGGNARDSASVVVFTTGDSIPRTRISGAIFDWVKGIPGARAYVEARPAGDTTVIYAAEADSSGRYSLPYMSPGPYVVRALLDANRNRSIDSREAWDSAHVTLSDTLARDFYAFPRDSGGPGIASVTVVDSLTLRVTLDRPVSNAAGYAPAIDVRTRDSVPVPIARVVPWSVVNAERERVAAAARDSAANADTSAVARQRRERARLDSINRAAMIADSLARLPNRIEAPRMGRPALVTEFGVTFARAPEPGEAHIVTVVARDMFGTERTTTRSFTRPRPAAPAVRDTLPRFPVPPR